jgi:hypothetical protein
VIPLSHGHRIRDRLSLNKQAALKFDMERFNPKKLSDVEIKEQYQVKISNGFAAVENLDHDDDDDDVVDISRPWESIRENIKASILECLDYYELKEHKLWFYDACSKLLD